MKHIRGPDLTSTCVVCDEVFGDVGFCIGECKGPSPRVRPSLRGVKRYVDDESPPWPERYERLEKHHLEETEALLRALAASSTS